MRLYNPYTKQHLEYPIHFEPTKLNYQVRHETPFSERYSEWAVSILDTGDRVYIPCGQNRSHNIYVVTKLYLEKKTSLPYGIYTIPMSYFLYNYDKE